MFKQGQDLLLLDPTPERIFSICSYIAKHTSSRDDLFENFCMPRLTRETVETLRDTLSVAVELDLIVLQNTLYRATQQMERIADFKDFRKYCSETILRQTDTKFFRSCSVYIEKADDMIACSGWDAIRAKLGEFGVTLSDNEMKAWRFWISFLGLGYLQQRIVIPNCYIRFCDVLSKQTDFQPLEIIDMQTFVDWLEAHCPEIRTSRHSRTQLGLASSNGLRMMHARNDIRLITRPDAPQWSLYRFERENNFSHVQIMR